MKYRNFLKIFINLVLVFSLTNLFAGEYPKTIIAKYGTTPTLDGNISDGEYDDAYFLAGLDGWESGTKQASTDADDLSVKCWIKHDGEHLYFAFDVNDDLIYGKDIEKWVHENNPTPHTLDYDGWPWFGDGMEIMMNSSYKWNKEKEALGDAKNWQVVFSTHKSIVHGLDSGGLMMGVPDTDYAWGNYRNWIDNGHIKTAWRFKSKEEGRGYVVEWQISPNPCMMDDMENYIDLTKETKVGINFEFQDLDEKDKGEGNWSNMHHIDFLARVDSYRKTALISFATLLIEPAPANSTSTKKPSKDLGFSLHNNYPNPFSEETQISYSLNQAKSISLSIYNQLGQEVKSLIDSKHEPGAYAINWNGRNNKGDLLPNGIYFAILAADNNKLVKKIVILN